MSATAATRHVLHFGTLLASWSGQTQLAVPQMQGKQCESTRAADVPPLSERAVLCLQVPWIRPLVLLIIGVLSLR
jgi:hypothetical protein